MMRLHPVLHRRQAAAYRSVMAHRTLSVTLPERLARFVESCRDERGLATTSEVVARAVELLRTADLERAYARASREVDPGWDFVVADGVDA